jgi:hypothetical protein
MRTLAASASGRIGLPMKKQIQISGTYKLDNKTDSFKGTVTVDERENSIYYSWTLFDEDGKSIGAKSLNVAFQQIPVGHDRFEFTKAHAIEGIREFRIGREKIVHELSVD